jgi:serine/threonine-protein kinase
MLKPDLAEDPTQLQRFFNEARVASQLSHPHTVKVFDFGQTDNGLLYIAMELLHGVELKKALDDAGGTMDTERTVRIAISVLKSLAEAHDAGLVHRDLKPDNVFLCRVHGEDDFVKVIDFGIAKATNQSSDSGLTKTGFTVGTPKYMSPEQVLNKPLDGRSDLYALGVILYQCLTGDVPFVGASPMETLMAHLQQPPPDLRERAKVALLPGLHEVVQRALAKQPWDRFGNASEMQDALEEVLVQAGVGGLRRTRSGKMAAVPKELPAGNEDVAAPERKLSLSEIQSKTPSAPQKTMVERTPIATVAARAEPAAGTVMLAQPMQQQQPEPLRSAQPRPRGMSAALMIGGIATVVAGGAGALWLAMHGGEEKSVRKPPAVVEEAATPVAAAAPEPAAAEKPERAPAVAAAAAAPATPAHVEAKVEPAPAPVAPPAAAPAKPTVPPPVAKAAVTAEKPKPAKAAASKRAPAKPRADGDLAL